MTPLCFTVIYLQHGGVHCFVFLQVRERIVRRLRLRLEDKFRLLRSASEQSTTTTPWILPQVPVAVITKLICLQGGPKIAVTIVMLSFNRGSHGIVLKAHIRNNNLVIYSIIVLQYDY